MNRIHTFIATLALSFLALPLFAGQPGLDIKNAWVQEGPPNASVLAGFMLITNNSDKSISITAAESKLFRSIEFHRTVHADGMARMLKQQQLTIAPGATLKLEHGGYHLMMMQPVKRLANGDSVKLEFTLSTNEHMSITLPVRQPDQEQQHHHHHH